MTEREKLRISPEEAHRLFVEEDATPVDVIDSHSYDRYHHQIEGAVRIAPEDIGEKYDQIPKDHAALAY